jgi:hypothetical protein
LTRSGGVGSVSYIEKSPITGFIDAAPAKSTMTQIKDFKIEDRYGERRIVMPRDIIVVKILAHRRSSQELA